MNNADNITNTYNEINEMMTMDKSQEFKSSINTLMTKIVNNVAFITSLNNNIAAVFADGKLTFADIPKLMIVTLQLNKTMPKIVDTITYINKDCMKYITYGIIYFYIINNIPDFFKTSFSEIDIDKLSLDEFRMLFSNLWDLVEITPNIVDSVKESKNGWNCCKNTNVK